MLWEAGKRRPAARRVQKRCRRLRRRQRTGLIDVSGHAASPTTYQESPDVRRRYGRPSIIIHIAAPRAWRLRSFDSANAVSISPLIHRPPTYVDCTVEVDEIGPAEAQLVQLVEHTTHNGASPARRSKGLLSVTEKWWAIDPGGLDHVHHSKAIDLAVEAALDGTGISTCPATYSLRTSIAA